mmetsp:Transcript_77186/g.136218  ORF Transcript_77186/g.136218 Transcript_77186/m.136218 type:complete len:417 (-) Transcript_77186:55-1305(-)
MKLKKAVQAVSAQDRLKRASSQAVSEHNTPGKVIDLEGESYAAVAASAIQASITGEDFPDNVSVIVHHRELFACIRRTLGRSEDHFNNSLCESDLRLVGQEQAAGKSNAFFVFTDDGRYCMKSVDPAEAAQLLRILPEYEAYVTKNPDTLLPKFYALYEVYLPRLRAPLWMMVMGNVLGGRQAVLQRFDLKGSTHGRKASAKERAEGQKSVLKDLDFVFSGCSIEGVSTEAERSWQQAVQAMKKDSQWLASQNLIDYSLLLGFATCSQDELKAPLSHVVRMEVKGDALGSEREPISGGDALIVYVGIVDCLMPYGWFKRLENLVCDAFLSADISCQPPKKYAERFFNFVSKLGLPPGELEAFTSARVQASQRPLGKVVGEFGRKDAIALAKSPAALVLVGGLASLVVAWRSGHLSR